MNDGESDVTVAWRMWIADNLARGVDRERVLERLLREGVDAPLARATIASIEASPQRVRGLARAWIDLDGWSPDALDARFGEVRVAATVDRDDDPDYPHSFRRRTREMPLGALVERMRRGPSNDVYLVAQNHALQHTALGELLESTLRAPGPALASRRASLWMGPAGTITPFHHDPMDLVALQVHGRKRWRLIAPTDRAWLARVGQVGPYTLLDPERDAIAGVTVRELVIEEGDAIFVPASTWHHVVAETPSITISLTALGRDRSWLDA
ncbi:MAG: cupin-like domain-containing protein [Myxococcota bacterium]|nr:cupin-like domain-containing protein [Myxococcota bacterium]